MKKKLIILFLIFLTMLPAGVMAQRSHKRGQVIRAYPQFGFTASQIRGDELRGFKKFGITAGVGAEVDISERFKFSLEADFSQRGIQNKIFDPYGIINFTMNYVDIPLTLHFTDPYGGITLGAGLVYGRLVQQPHGLLIYNANYFMPDTSDMSFLKNDLCAAIDLRFAVWQGLTINLRWQHSIIPVKRDWMFTEHFSSAPNDFKTWSNNCYNSSVSVRILYILGSDQYKSKYHKTRYKPHRSKKNKRRR